MKEELDKQTIIILLEEYKELLMAYSQYMLILDMQKEEPKNKELIGFK